MTKHTLKRFLPTACRKSFRAGKAGEKNQACKHCWAAGIFAGWRSKLRAGKLLGSGK